MANRMTIDELKSYLWESAVLLRTNIDAGAYKQYIFPLLFFKRICDVYDEETAAAIDEYGDDIGLYPEEGGRSVSWSGRSKSRRLPSVPLIL